MYSVYGDGICIYNDLLLNSTSNALTPQLKLADNTAGTFEITLPVGNAGYDKLERLSSEIVVKRYDDEIWAGRIIGEKKNFQNSRILTCEGELAYFNDTTQPPTEYNEIEVYNFIEALLEEHNSKVAVDKQFEMGSITVHDTISRITNNETTMNAISEHLINKLKGHIRIRRVYDEDGILHKYFDYLKDYPNTNGQEIRFGENLLDFTRNWDMSEYATVITPRGAKLDSSPIESVDAYLDVSEVNGGSRYVTNEEAIKRYGWIELVVDWEDVTDPQELLQKAEDYLADEQFDDVVIDVSAVDLRYILNDVQPINLLDNVRCISKPHGMNKVFPVTELSIQLDKPENSTYTLGDKTKENTLTASTRRANEEILERMDSIPNEKTILDKAKDNATAILNMNTQGFVTIIKNDKGSQSLVISSENANTAYDPIKDTWSEDTKIWMWNINGLGYSKDGGRNFGTAIRMDGAIVADYITTGTMSADRIRTGMLKSVNGNTKWDLDTGVLTMTKGSITLGNGNFSVNDNGYLTAEYGKIGGFTISAYSIYNDVINLDSKGISFYIDNNYLGYQGSTYWTNNPDIKGLAFNLEHDAGFITWGIKDNAVDEFYTIKLMYTSVDLVGENGETLIKDRIHLGAYMQLNQYGFSYRYGNQDLKSFSYGTYQSSGNFILKEAKLVTKVSITTTSAGNYTISSDGINCYICNGVLMLKE